MAKVIIQHNGSFVAGFSETALRVYYTRNPNSAYRFESIEANKFLVDHDNKGHGFRIENVRLHLVRMGEKFNPFGDKRKITG
jgi:hypothetical protein